MSLAPGTRLRTGDVVDGFVVGEVVHEGALSTIRRARRPGDERALLMKVPRLLEGSDPAAVVGFEMEQMILPKLSGAHVPAFVAAESLAYLVMEEVPGASLLERLPDLPLPALEVAAIGARVATALHDVHRQHVVHLDVKPSNVLLRPTGEAVLIDFGLARHERLPDLMAEEFRVPYGTGPYMAPEQVLGVRRDPRSDLFALGVLLYFFATGERPFGEPRGRRALHRRLWRDPPPPRAIRGDVPPWLQEVLLRCLEVDAARRHPTAAQLAFDLSHPDQVPLGERAARLRRDPWSVAWRRRLRGPEIARTRIDEQVASAPVVAVAVDLEGDAELADALRETVRRGLERLPGTRFACLYVLRQHRIALDTTLDEDGRHRHAARLAELRRWAKPLGLEVGRLTFHVLEAPDAADAILEYASANRVDHVVLGARSTSWRRALLGSVSAKVATDAPCTVTVVRPARPARGAGAA